MRWISGHAAVVGVLRDSGSGDIRMPRANFGENSKDFVPARELARERRMLRLHDALATAPDWVLTRDTLLRHVLLQTGSATTPFKVRLDD